MAVGDGLGWWGVVPAKGVFVVKVNPNTSRCLAGGTVSAMGADSCAIKDAETVRLFSSIRGGVTFGMGSLLSGLRRKIRLTYSKGAMSVLSAKSPNFSNILGAILEVSGRGRFPGRDVRIVPKVDSLRLTTTGYRVR